MRHPYGKGFDKSNPYENAACSSCRGAIHCARLYTSNNSIMRSYICASTSTSAIRTHSFTL